MDDHRALSQIPHFHNVFTTNYDTLLEDSYDKKDCQVIRKDDDCAYIDNAKPVKIFKIHGDFVNQDFVIITTEDYNAFFKKNPNPLLWNLVKQEFLTKHILFIGYSLADDNIIKIIKNIAVTINRNQKDMFLIAPGINKRRQGQLKKMKVHYFDAYATDFFAELTKELKANIAKDFRHHKVSAETFSRFCFLHNIDPSISIHPDSDNQIEDFKSVDGKGLQHSLNLSLPNRYKDFLENIDFEKNGVIVKNSPFPNVPAIRLEADKDFSRCTHSINGVVINDEIASVLIAPPVDNFPMTITIPSRSFIEKVIGQKYSPREGKTVINLDCHIFRLEITVVPKEKTELGTPFSVTFTFHFYDTYTNNNDAIKWIELLCAFYSKEDVYIKGVSSTPFNAGSIIGALDARNDYNQYKRYYNNIKQIEILSGTNFTTYNCYTDNNLNTSCAVVSYLEHQPLLINSSDGFNFTTEAKISSDFVEYVGNSKEICVVSTEDTGRTFKLNDRSFEVPYIHKIFNSCEVVNVFQQENGNMKIDFHYEASSYFILFSDKPAKEEFPQLATLEDITEIS